MTTAWTPSTRRIDLFLPGSRSARRFPAAPAFVPLTSSAPFELAAPGIAGAGLGPIRVAQLMPIVVSPARFRTKRQFWSYCGLGIVMRSSSDWVRTKEGGWSRAEVQKTRGLNLNHNHALKNIFKGAATTVIAQLEAEPLHQDYQRLIAAGTKPNLAKLTIARKLAAIALSMWKSKERYDPTKHRKQK